MQRKHPFAGRHIIALDIETTPGAYGTRPTPLCVCLYIPFTREVWTSTIWGPGCIDEATRYLSERAKKKSTKYAIIAHNGGKFDFGYFEQNDGAKRVVGSRLLETTIAGIPCLDTMLLMPTALKNLGTEEDRKGVTDLSWHTLEADEFQRRCVIEYCVQDCRVLANAYMRFAKVFTGSEFEHPKMTAASNAFAELKATLENSRLTLFKTTGEFDAQMRPYYHGGIVNTFGPARDIIGDFLMVDANSMYPGAMKNYKHPGSNGLVEVVDPTLTRDGFIKGFGDRVFFIHFSGWSAILPHVKPTGGLEYDVTGEYWVTSHELQAALRYGFVRVDQIHKVYICRDEISFGEFVDKFYGLRQECKKNKDPVEYVYKIVLNSAYGKFGQDIRNYGAYATSFDAQPPEQLEKHTPWRKAATSTDGTITYWEADRELDPSEKDFINVAVAASITGASRACLIDAIGAVVSSGGVVHYCDTDSIAFEGAPTMNLGAELGQWKVEGEFDRLIIAAPKLYAFHDKKGKWKVASKGVKVTPDQIADLVAGKDDLCYYPEMGSHDWQGNYRTTKRTIKRETIGVTPK